MISKGVSGTGRIVVSHARANKSQQWLDHIAVFEQILRPAAVVGDGCCRINAQDVIKSSQDVLRAVGAGDRIFAKFVGGADVLAHF